MNKPRIRWHPMRGWCFDTRRCGPEWNSLRAGFVLNHFCIALDQLNPNPRG